jgi:hypothetical protein
MNRKVRHLIEGIIVVIGLVCCANQAEAMVKVQSFKGVVEVFFEKEQQWQPLVGTPELQAGDQIRTGQQGAVELRCDDGSLVQLQEQTQVTISEAKFSEAQKTRIFRIKLLQGTVNVKAVKVDFTRFTLTNQSLEALRKEGLAIPIAEGPKILQNREVPEEAQFLDMLKKQIGGKDTTKYKFQILQAADTQQNVFAIVTNIAVFSMNPLKAATEATIATSPTLAVTIQRDRVKIQQTAEGTIKVIGLVDGQEGLSLPVKGVGVWTRIGVDGDDRKITLESSSPLREIQTLIGGKDTILKAENLPDTPPFVLNYGGMITKLKEDQAVTFGIPSYQVIPVEIPEFANAVFQFLEWASFILVDRGCPELNGNENCCGASRIGEQLPIETKQEQPVVPPAPYSPPKRPKQTIGSPIMPEK